MGSFVGWDVVAVVFPLVLFIGLGVLAVGNFRWGKFWFSLAAGILAAKLALVAAPAWPDLGWLLMALAIIGVSLWLTFRRVSTLELRDSVRLRPGNFPTPPIPRYKEVPSNAFMVFYAGGVSCFTKMPHTILELASLKMLVIDRDKRGNNFVVTTLKLFDDRNNIIATIKDGVIWVENSTQKLRPDPHTLIVYDHTDTEVLHLTYLNRRAFSITGVFRNAGFTATVTPDLMDLENPAGKTGRISGSFFFGDHATDIRIG